VKGNTEQEIECEKTLKRVKEARVLRPAGPKNPRARAGNRRRSLFRSQSGMLTALSTERNRLRSGRQRCASSPGGLEMPVLAG